MNAYASISCSDGHCVGITKEGVAYAWATQSHGNRFGQLCRGFVTKAGSNTASSSSSSSGNSNTAATANTTATATDELQSARAINVPGLPDGVAIAKGWAGGRKDSGHTALLDTGGNLWMCGCDRWTQLGRGGTSGWADGAAWNPTAEYVAMPGGAAVQQAALGADHTVALLSNGGVVAFGRGHKGQVTGGSRGPHT
eukprot:gene23029-6331_t